MKIAILGASGAMAAVVVQDLLHFAEDIRITAADIRPLPAYDNRVTYRQLNASDVNSTTRILDGHDAVLNCVNYYFNVPIMKAALAARVPYADLGGLYHVSLKQFELHGAFEKAGVTAVLGMGSTPGITNVMAGHLVSGMDEVHELHVRVGCWDAKAAGPLPVPYALETIMDEFALEPFVFQRGIPLAVPAMSGEESVDFPEPVGRATAIYTLHSEVAMFPRSFPSLREASFKIAFPGDFVRKMRFLVELGFASREPVINGVSPRAMLLALVQKQPANDFVPEDCDVLRVQAKGVRNGENVSTHAQTIVTPDRDRRIAAGSLDTGVPLSIVGQMLAGGEIATPGVLCPEVSVPADRFFAELARRNIHVRTESH